MKILSLTLDPELALLRHHTLTAAGHNVTSSSTEKEIQAACKRDASYDVVLICHKIPAASARPLVRLLKNHKPQARVVFIAHIYGEWPEVEADRYVVGADGPEALLRLLEEMATDSH